MGNFFYGPGLEGFADGSITWTNGSIHLVCLSTEDYEARPEHRILAEIPVDARVAVSEPLAGKSAANGELRASTVAFKGLVGYPINALAMVQMDPDDTEQSRLIMYLDSGERLPILPNGGTIEFSWEDDIVAVL